MRNLDYMKKHLSILTQIDNQTIRDEPVEDPFHHTTVVVGWTFWEWLKMLFRGKKMEVRVKVCADGVALGRWFQGADICEKCKRTRISGPGQHETKPGYEYADERWCQACYYDYPVTGSVREVADGHN